MDDILSPEHVRCDASNWSRFSRSPNNNHNKRRYAQQNLTWREDVFQMTKCSSCCVRIPRKRSRRHASPRATSAHDASPASVKADIAIDGCSSTISVGVFSAACSTVQTDRRLLVRVTHQRVCFCCCPLNFARTPPAFFLLPKS